MKIEWLDNKRERARVTRGWLWWKRDTLVVRRGGWFHFEASGNRCPDQLDRWLFKVVAAEEARDRQRGHESEWQRPARLPRAEVRS